jgi:flagellar protein FlaG
MNITALGSTPAASFGTARQNSAEGLGTIAETPNATAAKAANVTEQAPQPVNEIAPSQLEAQPGTPDGPTKQAETPSNRQEVDKAVKAVNDFVSTVNSSLKFSTDEDSGQMVVKVIDNTTQEVIKQIPSKEMLEMAKALNNLKGLLVQQKA